MKAPRLTLLTFLALLPLLCSPSPAAQCLDHDSLKLSWQAFKTPKKIAVKGAFQDFTLKKVARDPSMSLKDQISLINLTINPLKLKTGNEARDANIKKYFFSDMKPITLKVRKVTKKWIETDIQLGGKKKRVPFSYFAQKNEIEAHADIDLLDFKLSALLQKINKACFSMHEGKTWSHVKLSVKASLSDCSKVFKE